MMNLWMICFLITISYNSCAGNSNFDYGTAVSRVLDFQISEASGIAISRKHKNILYTFNDSGGAARIYAVNITSGYTVARLDILGATNCDWEDIAIGPGPDGSTVLIIGDVGGNTGSVCLTLYRVKEPDVLEYGTLNVDSKVIFSWDENNCETVMINPEGQVYIVSKVGGGAIPKLYPIPPSAWGAEETVHLSAETGSPVTLTTSSGPLVAGDISYLGDEVLIKTNDDIFYWRIQANESLASVLQKTPKKLKYIPERQGEAIAWVQDGKGFYTLSEGRFKSILYYKRLVEADEGRTTVEDRITANKANKMPTINLLPMVLYILTQMSIEKYFVVPFE